MKLILIFVLSFIFAGSSALPAKELLSILETSLNKEMSELTKREIPPYYIRYRVDDESSTYIRASFGIITDSYSINNRYLTTQVRVGNNNIDNFKEIREGYGSRDRQSYAAFQISTDNSPQMIMQAIWLDTDEQYKNAVERYERVVANMSVVVDAEDKSDDFSKEQPNQHYEEPLTSEETFIDVQAWKKKLTELSKLFYAEPKITDSSLWLNFKVIRKYIVDTEGTRVVHNLPYATLAISGFLRADDGMELPLSKTFFEFFPDKLPSEETLKKHCLQLISTLSALRNAPVVTAYTGPTILSPEASAVFFHEIFGHRIEGHRLKSESDAQTFKNMLGKPILPTAFSVKSLSSEQYYKNFPLNGYISYDDEGRKSENVELIKDGILERFMMSRIPIEGFSVSNGHGRAQTGYQPISRQTNLIISSSNPHTSEQSLEKMRTLLKEKELDYGYYFETVSGGFTQTSRFMPNSFNVTPLVVYRVYADEREKELVRGVDLVGTPLAMFSQIDSAGDDDGLFFGTCGAESGGVPVSAISPSLFVRQIETQRRSRSQTLPYLLPRPDLKNNEVTK